MSPQIANLGLTALVLGLLAFVTIVTLGMKACCDYRRREKREKKLAGVPSIRDESHLCRKCH